MDILITATYLGFICHKAKIKCLLSKSSAKGKSRTLMQLVWLPWQTSLLLTSLLGPLQNIQCYLSIIYSIFQCYLRKYYTESTQRLLCQFCSAHCCAVDAQSFASPPHTSIWLFCKETFCCLKREVMFSWKCTGCEVAAPGIHQGNTNCKHSIITVEFVLQLIVTDVMTILNYVQCLPDSVIF